MGDKPVNFVSWYDSARFTNWMNNGQGTGSTETGAYTLTGSTGLIPRNAGAQVWLPSEDEWYKAAYYDPTLGAGGGDNYWSHATKSDSAPIAATVNTTGGITNSGANVANYNSSANWNDVTNGNVTTVGSAGAFSFYGTADQAGNALEWTDSKLSESSNRLVVRGGAFYTNAAAISSTSRGSLTPNDETGYVGFRIASVPEPSGLVLTMLAGGMMSIRRKR
jgi:formylglycine-generating enzyme required for sulfatase activity